MELQYPKLYPQTDLSRDMKPGRVRSRVSGLQWRSRLSDFRSFSADSLELLSKSPCATTIIHIHHGQTKKEQDPHQGRK